MKVIQYSLVIIAEFNVHRRLLRLFKGRNVPAELIKEWYMKTRGLASMISTSRMALRLVNWLGCVKFFVD